MSGRGNVSSTSSGARDRALAGRGIQHETAQLVMFAKSGRSRVGSRVRSRVRSQRVRGKSGIWGDFCQRTE